MTYRAFYCLTLSLLGIATIQPAHVAAQNPDSSNDRQQIESAWRHRTDVVKSLILTADVVEVTKGRGPRALEPPGPFSEDVPETDRTVSARLDFYFDRGKAVMLEIKQVAPDEENARLGPHTLHATFDGQLNAALHEQGEFRSGSIERKATAGAYISRNTSLLALSFWLQPQLAFKDTNWNTRRLIIENKSTEVNGVKCRRLTIPRSSSNWTSTLDVDADNDWLPVQWQTWLGGRPTMKLEILYTVDQNVGRVVSGWKYTQYDRKDGRIEITRSAEVIKCETNVKIPPQHFTIDFPIGTRIYEDTQTGRRYYTQKPGAMVPIEETKPTPKTPGATKSASAT
jgi:hypothetical protein